MEITEKLQQTISRLMNTPPPEATMKGIFQAKEGSFSISYPIDGMEIDHYFSFPKRLKKSGRGMDEETLPLLKSFDDHSSNHPKMKERELLSSFVKSNPELFGKNRTTRNKKIKNVKQTIRRHRYKKI